MIRQLAQFGPHFSGDLALMQRQLAHRTRHDALRERAIRNDMVDEHGPLIRRQFRITAPARSQLLMAGGESHDPALVAFCEFAPESQLPAELITLGTGGFRDDIEAPVEVAKDHKVRPLALTRFDPLP